MIDCFWAFLAQYGFLIVPWGAIWIDEGEPGVCGFDETLQREWCT